MANLAPETLDRLRRFQQSEKFNKLMPETQNRFRTFIGDKPEPELAFKRPTIPFAEPNVGIIPDPGRGLQNLSATAQREEAALAGAGEEALSGRFKNIPKEFMRGLKGEQTTQIGDLFRRRGANEDVSSALGFAGSLVTPSNLALTALTGGAGKALTPKLTKPVSKVPGAIRNFLGGVEGKTIKDLRNIVDRLGVGKVFKGGTERRTFVGKELTPRVQDIVTRNIDNLEPTALKELGLPDELIGEMRNISSPQGMGIGDKIRHTVKTKLDIAGQKYEKARRSLPKDFKFDVRGLRGRVGGILRDRGVIDETGKLIRPIVDDPPQIQGIYRLWNELSERVRVNRPSRIGGLLSQEGEKIVGKVMPDGSIRGSGKAGIFGTGEIPKDAKDEILRSLVKADELDSDQFFRNRLNLQGLLSGEKQFDRLVLQVIDVMDNAAEKSGSSSLKDAVTDYRNAKGFQDRFGGLAGKADEKAEKFTRKTSLEGKLRASQQEERVSLREELSKLIGGKQADEILDLSQANRILTDPGIEGVGKMRNAGWLQTGRNVVRRGIRSYEENISPKLRDLSRRASKSKLGKLSKYALGLSERKATTKLYE